MRQIHLDSGIWTYKVGKGAVVIRDPNRKAHIVWAWHLHLGQSPVDYEKGQYKRTEDGMVKPAEIRDYIINNLLPKQL